MTLTSTEPLVWTDKTPTEEGWYLLRNKAISRGIKRALCRRFNSKGPLFQTMQGIGGKAQPVTSIYDHWWFGPIPNPPVPKD